MRTLSVDIETYSEADLPKVGVYQYAAHPSFEILLLAYSYGGGPVGLVDLAGEGHPEEWAQILEDLQDPTILKTAWNAVFERTCLAAYFGRPMPAEQWSCSMVAALRRGLPASLAQAGDAIGLGEDQQKMKVGKALIRYFCVPCPPTAKNGGRRRNLPAHDPAKWDLFKDYCKRDVEVEMAIKQRLGISHPLFEDKLWVLDQKINDHGILIDPELVAAAIKMDEENNQKLRAEYTALTGLPNVAALGALKNWLEKETGETVGSLTKDDVGDWLEKTTGKAHRALEIRQALAKASVAKYDAMRRAVGNDGRIRGLFQFYGANRTGRWAGRLVQLQNLPKNEFKDLDLARRMVLQGDLEGLEMVFGSPGVVLSQLIRTAFVPPEGKQFVVADFSAIEARVIAWLAGEQWRMDIFATHGKIYEASAAAMFKVPIESITKGHPLRQKGKVAELACIAEGQMVLTDRGLVAIEKVTLDDLVWDGISYVKHKGVVYQGIKEVKHYDGLTATPDHLVWVQGQDRPIRFEDAAASGACLLQPGTSWSALWVDRNHIPGAPISTRLVRRVSAGQVSGLWSGIMGTVIEFDSRPVQGLSGVQSPEANTPLARPQTDGGQAEVHQPEGRWLSKLRRAWNNLRLLFSPRGGTVGAGQSRAAGPGDGAGQNKQRRALRPGKHPTGDQDRELLQPTGHAAPRVAPGGVALRSDTGDTDARQGDDAGANNRVSPAGGAGKTQELAGDRREARVYDILDCGPNNRYTVNGRLVHNCGYQGGPNALIKMGALKGGLTEEELPRIVRMWRNASPNIVKFWKDTENAVYEVLTNGGKRRINKYLTVWHANDELLIWLPSGRAIVYQNPQILEGGKISYMGMNQTSKAWLRQETYGGKLVENIVQAVARDCLAVSMVRLAEAGYTIAMHVHDEVVAEGGDLEEACRTMGEPIEWAPGLVLRADGYTCGYYVKE
jgi:DNA polymerase